MEKKVFRSFFSILFSSFLVLVKGLSMSVGAPSFGTESQAFWPKHLFNFSSFATITPFPYFSKHLEYILYP